MPELPEVETVVRGLRAAGLVGRRIRSACVVWPRTLAQPARPAFLRHVRGLVIENLGRRGKFIVFELSGGWRLLAHLRMSGRFHLAASGAPARPHEQLILRLDDGRDLRFHDPRKFGRIWLTRDPGAVLGALGPEPLDARLRAETFRRRLAGSRRRIKPLLLDQAFIAGVGNIYADEALWEAGIHPLRPADTIPAAEARRLLAAIRKVLRRGIRNLGTTLGGGATHFQAPRGADGQNQEALNAYQQTGRPCARCGTRIRRMLVGQRSTHFCPQCQPRPRRKSANP